MNNMNLNNNGGNLSDAEKALKRINLSRIIIISVTIALLLAALLFLILMETPENVPPRIVLKNMEGGELDKEYTLKVFDDLIYPGTDGEFSFRVENPHNQRVNYSFEIEPLYNGEPIDDFPIDYRIRLNNGLLNTEAWLDADELNYKDLTFLPETEHLITIEWRWLFEQGNDALDTAYGMDNGEYSFIFHITAVMEEE